MPPLLDEAADSATCGIVCLMPATPASNNATTRILRGLRSFVDLGLPQLSRADTAELTSKIRSMAMLPKRPLHFALGTPLSIGARTAYYAHAAILLLKWGGNAILKTTRAARGVSSDDAVWRLAYQIVDVVMG